MKIYTQEISEDRWRIFLRITMPRRPKFDPKKAAINSAKKTMSEIRATRIEEGVQRETAKQYGAMFQRAEIFRKELKELEWNEDLYLKLLDELAESGVTSGESWRSALIHGLTAAGKETAFLFGVAARKATDSLSFQHRLRQTCRGTVTAPMMKEFIQWLVERGKSELASFCVVSFECQLRGHELKYLAKGDYYSDGTAWLLIRKDKRQNRANDRARSFEKIIPEKGLRALQMLGEGKEHGELLFPEAEQMSAALGREIKLAADDLKWPTGLAWSGHVLRHGGTRPLLEEATRKFSEAAINQTSHTIKRYAKSVKERK